MLSFGYFGMLVTLVFSLFTITFLLAYFVHLPASPDILRRFVIGSIDSPNTSSCLMFTYSSAMTVSNSCRP